jgi:hypothetical protein
LRGRTAGRWTVAGWLTITGRHCAHSTASSGGQSVPAHRRQRTRTGHQTLNDPTSARRHARTKTSDFRTAGRAESPAATSPTAGLHRRLLHLVSLHLLSRRRPVGRRRLVVALRKRRGRNQKRCYNEDPMSDAVCHLGLLPCAPAESWACLYPVPEIVKDIFLARGHSLTANSCEKKTKKL